MNAMVVGSILHLGNEKYSVLCFDKTKRYVVAQGSNHVTINAADWGFDSQSVKLIINIFVSSFW